MKKRVLCFVLSLIMIGSVAPVTNVQAASSVIITSIKNNTLRTNLELENIINMKSNSIKYLFIIFIIFINNI